MNQKPLLKFDTPETKEYAEWITIGYDLNYVIETTRRLSTHLDEKDQDSILIKSLWSSALTAYIRCFGTGTRIKLEPSIFEELPGDPIETHQYYKDTRDKHIAHPVNIFEEIQVGLITNNDSIEGIGHLYAQRLCDAKEGVAQLGRLATFALRYVKGQINKLESEVLEQAKKLNKKNIEGLQPIKITPQGGAEAAVTVRK
jgi:hypothetical protein